MKKIKVSDILWAVLLIILMIGVIAVVVLRIWAVATYGNTPVAEAPVWVYWLLRE